MHAFSPSNILDAGKAAIAACFPGLTIMGKRLEAGPGVSILGAFALMVMLVLSGGMVLYGNGSQLLESNRMVMHTYQVEGKFEAIRSSVTTAESAVRGYILLGNDSFVKQFQDSAKAVELELDQADEMTRDNALQQQNIKVLRPLIAKKLDLLAQGLAHPASARNIVGGKDSPGPKVMAQINDTIDRMEKEEDRLLVGRESRNRQAWERAAAAFWAGILVQVLALVGLLILASRLIRTQYKARMGEATHRAELEREVELRTAELKSTNEELESFSAAVSHDLQSPLRHIDAVASMLREDMQPALTSQQDSDFGRIRREVRRMNQIIEDLLRLSRTARGEVQLAQVNLSGLVQEIWSELVERNGDTKVTLTAQAGVQAEADPNMLRILVENLLSNARKYSSKADTPKVEFGATVVDGVNTYFFRDNGVGFNPAYVNKLFQPFTRLHSEKDFEGSGLGLAICKRIVARHGGRIWAESELGHGATFYFTLHPPIPSGYGNEAAGTVYARRR